MANHTVILYCPKTAVFWDQIHSPPMEAPTTNLILLFLCLFHSVFLIFCKWLSFPFSAFILLFIFETSDELTVYIGSWLMIKFVSCLVIILKFSYSNFAVSWKNGIFNPPYRVNNDSSVHSLSEQTWHPVMAGQLIFCQIAGSN